MGRKQKKVVALVGRPNVGKSTLFNRLAGSRKAIVDDTPGLTRDRNYADATIDDKSFVIVDTGGFEPRTDDDVLAQMRTQTMVAVEQANVIIFMGDGQVGLTPSDKEIVRILQKTDKKVFYVVNKIDSEKSESNYVDFFQLGVESIYAISAKTRYGLRDFLDVLIAEIDPDLADPVQETLSEVVIPRVAVVGRPNVGKSTLINLLVGEERLVANPTPGTTRDSIDTIVKRNGREYLFIDTAGIRRRARITDRVETYSVQKAFRSIDRADVALVMLDAEEIVTDQDARIAGYAHDKCRCVVLALNKWDTIKKDPKTFDSCVSEVRRCLKFLDFAPVVSISALHGTRCVKVFDLIDDIFEKFRKRVSTATLNKFLETVLAQHPPGMFHRSKKVKIYYVTQGRIAPPVFTFFCNYPEAIHFSYRRFLENRLREYFDFGGSPLKLVFKKRVGKTYD
jgi:GTP-binding protein